MKFVCKIAKIDRGSLCDFTVAPHAGAWVEISSCGEDMLDRNWVAPHAGAWVEIGCVIRLSAGMDSRPPRGGVG